MVFYIGFFFIFRAPSTRDIPTVKRHWLFGHFLRIEKNKDRRNDLIYEVLLEVSPKQTYAFSLPLRPVFICISNPLCVKHVLKTNWKNYPKGDIVDEVFNDFLGKGIFAVDGLSWKFQRKTASHMFSMRSLKDKMFDSFIKHSDQFIIHLNNSNNSICNLSDLFYRYTLESICKIAFGVELGCLKKDKIEFMNAFDECQACVDKRFLMPKIAWKLLKFFKIGKEGQMITNLKILQDFSQLIINKRRKLNEQELSESIDLLSMFIALDKDENNHSFTDQYLRDIMMNFIIAGRDTTAQALSWLFYELSKSPEVEHKLRQEIQEFDIDQLTYDIISKKLPYTEAVIYETLRLHPSVPIELKTAKNHDILPDGTKIKKGDIIIPMFWQMGRLTSIWGNDALLFKPERMYQLDQEPSPYKFVAFQAGPRMCLGKRMAILEMKVILVKLLKTFKFNIVPNQDIKYRSALTLPMKNPLLFNYQKI